MSGIVAMGLAPICLLIPGVGVGLTIGLLTIGAGVTVGSGVAMVKESDEQQREIEEMMEDDDMFDTVEDEDYEM